MWGKWAGGQHGAARGVAAGGLQLGWGASEVAVGLARWPWGQQGVCGASRVSVGPGGCLSVTLVPGLSRHRVLQELPLKLAGCV